MSWTVPSTDILCESCGCGGNNDCDHECLGDDCTLDEPFMICPCCRIDPQHRRHAQEKADKQMELIA